MSPEHPVLDSHRRVGSTYIDPGATWDNGYGQALNGKLRDQLLEREELGSLDQASLLAWERAHEYNHSRRNTALVYCTPAEFAAIRQEERPTWPAAEGCHTGSNYSDSRRAWRPGRGTTGQAKDCRVDPLCVARGRPRHAI